MTPEERQMLASLFERIRSSSASPRDPQAEAFIDDAVRAVPQSPYVLAQTVLVQQHALETLQQRVNELEAQARANAAPPQAQTSFLGGLFGSAAPPAPPPSRGAGAYDASSYQRGAPPPPPPQQSYAPPPAYGAPPPPPPSSGPWGAPSGGGFLANALQTATGVAGGMVLANAVSGLFGGHSGGGLFGGHGFDSGLTAPHETINNYYVNDAPDRALDSSADRGLDRDDDTQVSGGDSGWGGGSDDSFDS